MQGVRSKNIPRKLVRVKMSRRLKQEMMELRAIDGKTLPQLGKFFLRVLIPIAQAECTFRVTPSKFDFDPVPEQVNFELELDLVKFLCEYAAEVGISFSQQVCQLWWVGVEEYKKFLKPGKPLRTEVLAKVIEEDMRRRLGAIVYSE